MIIEKYKRFFKYLHLLEFLKQYYNFYRKFNNKNKKQVSNKN